MLNIQDADWNKLTGYKKIVSLPSYVAVLAMFISGKKNYSKTMVLIKWTELRQRSLNWTLRTWNNQITNI